MQYKIDQPVNIKILTLHKRSKISLTKSYKKLSITNTRYTFQLCTYKHILQTNRNFRITQTNIFFTTFSSIYKHLILNFSKTLFFTRNSFLTKTRSTFFLVTQLVYIHFSYVINKKWEYNFLWTQVISSTRVNFWRCLRKSTEKLSVELNCHKSSNKIVPVNTLGDNFCGVNKSTFELILL